MTTITDARLKELVALAEKATGTDWADAYIPRSSNWQPTGYVVAVDADQTPVIAVVHPDAKVKSFGTLDDAAFIAAANPATVISMAKALLEARELVEDLAGSLRDFGGIQDVHGASALGRAADALDRADAMQKASQP